MATAAEIVFIQACTKAEGIRQSAKQAAFATYGFVAANLAAYLTALEAADNAYAAAVNSAASTCGVFGYSIPNSPPPNPGNTTPGTVGSFQPFGSVGATLGAIA